MKMEFNWAFNFDLSALISGSLKAVLIVVATWVLVWLLKRIIPRLIQARIPKIREESNAQLASRSGTLSRVVVRSLSFVIWVVAGMMIISVFGVNIAPVLAAVGLAGLAVGFAAQNIIRDYFNGFFIVMEDWFREGEVARVAGIAGMVVGMSLRRTTLRDLDGFMHVIPNSQIDLATNLTRDWSRINLDVTVAYKEDLDRVIGVINEVCSDLHEDDQWGPDLITTPSVLRVNDLGNHGVEIKILGDTKPIKQWGLMGELRRRLKQRFDQEGIEIPWPHTKVYFGDAPNGPGQQNWGNN